MESKLSKGCRLKLENFEGPFDLLFHLIEKNKINIYDIPINTITDQYMEYLFAMREMDMEIASEFLVMAATLLHIKSRMLLPDKRDREEEEEDPREELILRLVEYRKYKEFAQSLKDREKQWGGAFYRVPEFTGVKQDMEVLDLSDEMLAEVYARIEKNNMEKMDTDTGKMRSILRREQVTLVSKIKEISGILLKKGSFVFAEVFSLKKRSKTDVVTGFMALLELARLKKLNVKQTSRFSDIIVSGISGNKQKSMKLSGGADGH